MRAYGVSVYQAFLLLGVVPVLPVRAGAQSRISPTAAQLQAAADLRPAGGTADAGRAPRLAYVQEPAHDYRWEGLAIGAGVAGLAGALLMRGTCEANEACTGPTVGGFLLGAVVGGVTGGLIGAAISKGESDP